MIFIAVVTVFAATCIHVHYHSLNQPIPKFHEEIAKLLYNIGVTVIIGGLLKIIIDDYQKAKEDQDKKKDFSNELIHRLRNVFDQVELSKTLIVSHKSAKTYGERIREAIMPAYVSLFEIKRSLVDSDKLFKPENILNIRVSIHYMLAYLYCLIDEYQSKYSSLSNKQFYQEGIKAALNKYVSEIVVNQYTEKKSESSDSFEALLLNLIPPEFSIVQKELDKLPFLKDFISEGIETNYYRLFLDHFEYCKAQLKSDEEVSLPKVFNEKYSKVLAENDKIRRNADTTKVESLLKIIIANIQTKISI